jgi:hypothetical protein
MMDHNDGPALDCTNQFSTPPAASAGTSYAGNPPKPGVGAPGGSPRVIPLPPGCDLNDRRLPGLPRRWVRLPLMALCPAGPGAAHAGNARHSGRARERHDEDALEKDMNHYLIFLANAPTPRGRCDDHPSCSPG